MYIYFDFIRKLSFYRIEDYTYGNLKLTREESKYQKIYFLEGASWRLVKVLSSFVKKINIACFQPPMR